MPGWAIYILSIIARLVTVDDVAMKAQEPRAGSRLPLPSSRFTADMPAPADATLAADNAARDDDVDEDD